MKISSILYNNAQRLAVETDKGLFVLNTPNGKDLGDLLREGVSRDQLETLAQEANELVQADEVTFLTPIANPRKIVCVGLNYSDHTDESPYEQPDYPTLFLRVPTSLGSHESIVEKPIASDSLDFEGELIVVLQKGGRHIDQDEALNCVFGYSVGNEFSVREFQFKSPQWTMGKNFDGTGTVGPAVITADQLNPGATNLKIETRLNGETVQSANTTDMIHSVANIISTISEAITLEPGDIIFAGTPAGVGFGRDPKLYLKDGDVLEVEIENIGLLRNTVRDEKAQ